MSIESPRIPEKIYEDWLVENLHVLHPEARLAARQYGLPSGGVPDLLVLTPDGLTVVELKAVRATPPAVLQLLGYMGELLNDEKRALPINGVLAAPDISDDTLRALRGAGCGYLQVCAELSSTWRHEHRLMGQSNGVVWDALRHGIPHGTKASVESLAGPALPVVFNTGWALVGTGDSSG